MGSFKLQQNTQIKVQWINTDPDIKVYNKDVQTCNKCKFKKYIERIERKEQKQKEKQESREEFIWVKMEKLGC